MRVTSLSDMRTRGLWTAGLAELLGTAVLVLSGCGSCASWSSSGRSPLHIALAFGLSVATIVWWIGHKSGGHINPAVTVGFLVTRKISVVRALLYISMQMLGALLGAGVLRMLTPAGVNDTLCSPVLGGGVGEGQAFVVELVIGFTLVFTVFASCDDRRGDLKGSAPLTIGLSLTMCHLWAIPYTGSGMNPARVFGPSLVAGHWTSHWVYWAGPLVGGSLAAFIYDLLFAVNSTPAKVRGFFRVDYEDGQFDSRGRRTDGSDNVHLELPKV